MLGRLRPSRWHVDRSTGLAGLVYLALSCLAYWPVQPLSNTSVVSCGCYDVAEQTWFLAWTPHAIANGMNPFFTHALNVPGGVNLASNTSMPLLGLLGAPITEVFGPFATFNFFIRLAFAGSALAMFVMLRRWVAPWAAFVGGLVYGFSPYMVAQGSLHLNLVFAWFPPIVLIVLDELLVRDRLRPVLAGVLLGLACAGQYLVSAEICVDLFIVMVFGLLALAIRHPRQVVVRAGRVATGLLVGAATFGVIAAYPIVFALVGAEHVTAIPGVVFGNGTFRGDLLSPIIPTNWMVIAPSHWQLVADKFVNANFAENGLYLGIPLVLVVLCATVFVRRPIARLAGVLAIVSFVLSLGTQLNVDGRVTSVSLPFALVAKIPFIDIAVPSRFALFTALFAAMSLALGIDRLARSRRAGAAAPGSPSRLAKARRLVAPAVVAVVAVVPIIPRMPYDSPSVGVPAFFTSSAVDVIPSGSTVVAYPYPLLQQNNAMAWQVEAGFRFNLIGGYVYTPFQPAGVGGGGAGGGIDPQTLDPATVEILFEDAAYGPPPGTALPEPLTSFVNSARQLFTTYKVQAVVLDRIGKNPAYAQQYMTLALGAPPRRFGSMDVWTGVPKLLDEAVARGSRAARKTASARRAARRHGHRSAS